MTLMRHLKATVRALDDMTPEERVMAAEYERDRFEASRDAWRMRALAAEARLRELNR